VQITYIGHATLLLEIAGVRVLTDPNFEPKLGRFLPRVTAPGLEIDALPKLDALLLTHAHADHLSFKSLDKLDPAEFPNDIFICGGAQIYEQALPRCSDLYLTLIKREVEGGDAFFPPFEDKFKLVEELRDTPEFKILHYRHKSLGK